MSYSGGLGNKLFQYALALRFASEGHRILHETTPACLGQKEAQFQLTRIFGIAFPEPTLLPLVYRLAARLNKFGIYHLWVSLRYQVVNDPSPLSFDQNVIALALQNDTKPLVLRGYWQNPQYFRDCREQILNTMGFPHDLTPGIRRVLQQIESSDHPVGIHFRRGDYVALNNGLNLAYYRRAIDLVRQAFRSPVFFLFSDDPRYVEEIQSALFLASDTLTIVESATEPDWGDLFLMTRCQGLVIANSTYSWWAGFLNQREDAVVWAPREWYVGRPVDELFPQGWQLVTSLGEAEKHG